MSLYLYTILLTIAVSVAAVVLHRDALRMLAATHSARHGRASLAPLIGGIIVAHCIEALLYAAGYWLGIEVLKLGSFSGANGSAWFGYIYFALETFTTQSVGDVFPEGPIRLMASIEPLVGLILIGWSTSFTFVLMRRHWR